MCSASIYRCKLPEILRSKLKQQKMKQNIKSQIHQRIVSKNFYENEFESYILYSIAMLIDSHFA